jgi:outer membrane protein assembly factor BamB
MATVLETIIKQEHFITQALRGRHVRGQKPSPRRQALRHEFHHGQWRHPWRLHGSNNANWLAARWGIVFLGTWLGLFALDAATGRLLWHALPTIDLSYVDPALAP